MARGVRQLTSNLGKIRTVRCGRLGLGLRGAGGKDDAWSKARGLIGSRLAQKRQEQSCRSRDGNRRQTLGRVLLAHGERRETSAARRGPPVSRPGREGARAELKGERGGHWAALTGRGGEGGQGGKTELRGGRGKWASASRPPGRGEGWPGFFFNIF